MHQVELYVDGACSGNPGPAGVGVVLKAGKLRKEFSMHIGWATNNIAEITAVIEGIKLLKSPAKTEVTIYTDSQLVEGFLVKGWLAKCNYGLVKELKSLLQQCQNFRVVKVKAHNGIPGNETCHNLAQNAIKEAHTL